MNSQQTNTTEGKGKYFLWLWASALLVLAIFLLAVFANLPELSSSGQEEVSASETAYGHVFEGLIMADELTGLELQFSSDSKYVLVGAALQGFYQSTGKESAWNFLLPEYEIAAQLIQRQPFPRPLTSGIRLEWELEEYPAAVAETVSPVAHPSGPMMLHTDHYSFTAAIPASLFDAEGSHNPYSLITIRAYSLETGSLLATTALNLGVSPEFGCARCHSDPAYGILQTHDLRNATQLNKEALSGKTISCKSCHTGITVQNGNLVSAGKSLSLSAAVHGWHAPYLAKKGEEACLNCHIEYGRGTDATHDGPKRMFMRDVHALRGVSCVSCHGFLEDHALALLQAEKTAGQPLAITAMNRISPMSFNNADSIKGRVPWVQQPDCLSCHDFEKKPHPQTASAFNKWTGRIGDRKALFGERTDGTGFMRCISCHGAPHSIYPAINPIGGEQDNLQPLQYQKIPRTLGADGNCALCHTLPMSNPRHHKLVPAVAISPKTAALDGRYDRTG